jgi:hypothetical protein
MLEKLLLIQRLLTGDIQFRTRTEKIVPITVATGLLAGATYTYDLTIDDDVTELRITAITNNLGDNIKIDTIYLDSTSTRTGIITIYEGQGQFHFVKIDIYPIITIRIQITNMGNDTQIRRLGIQKRRG